MWNPLDETKCTESGKILVKFQNSLIIHKEQTKEINKK